MKQELSTTQPKTLPGKGYLRKTMLDISLEPIHDPSSSIGKLIVAIQAIRSCTKRGQSSVLTSDMWYTTASHMNWELRELEGCSSLVRSIPICRLHWMYLGLTTETLKYSSETHPLTMPLNKPWITLTILEYWPRWCGLEHSLHISLFSQTWCRQSRNSWMWSISFRNILTKRWDSSHPHPHHAATSPLLRHCCCGYHAIITMAAAPWPLPYHSHRWCSCYTIVSSLLQLWWSRHCIVVVTVTFIALLCCRCRGYGGHTIMLLLLLSQWSRHHIVIVMVTVATLSCHCCCHGHGGHAIMLLSLLRLHCLCSNFGHYCYWTMVGEGKVFLGLKVLYLVMVIRSDCLEFGLCNSCLSLSCITFVAYFPFFLLTKQHTTDLSLNCPTIASQVAHLCPHCVLSHGHHP